jgi:shikimate 5-dehydrogenase
MTPNENTKYIARIHTKPNARGLNIYNPYFQEQGINAMYVLFYQNTPERLLNACKDLNFVGINTAGFESDSEFAKLIDNIDDSSKLVGHIGYLKNENGKLKAYYQGGEGLLAALLQKFPLEGQEIVVVGAGNVAKSLIYTMQKKGLKPKKLTLVNRTLSKAEAVAGILKNIDQVKPLSELGTLKGDVLINVTFLGGRDQDDVYTNDVIKNFGGVGDVTFEIEEPNIIKIAKSLNKKYSTGWDFFTYQGKVFLENVLDETIDASILKKYVEQGLRTVV